jgi:hypothetical protein
MMFDGQLSCQKTLYKVFITHHGYTSCTRQNAQTPSNAVDTSICMQAIYGMISNYKMLFANISSSYRRVSMAVFLLDPSQLFLYVH